MASEIVDGLMQAQQAGFDWAGECDRQASMVRELHRRIGFAKAEIREALMFIIDGVGGAGGFTALTSAEMALERALAMLETGEAK